MNVDERVIVPEHEVKTLLRDAGVSVPSGVVEADPAALGDVAARLQAPLVLKAFGPGILHKSEVGAVRLGLAVESLDWAVAQMAERLAAQGLEAAGYLVEEQHAGGLELIVGVVERPPYGHLVLLGLGGTLAEVVDRNVARLAPLSHDEAEEMVDAFPAARLFEGVRGGPPLDRKALVGLLLAVAGPDGVVSALGSRLSEFECNPVVLGPTGATALDARLLLHQVSPTKAQAAVGCDFEPLFRPRTIAVAGASSTKQGFGNRFLAAYKAAGWTDGLYAVHPSADEIDGVPAVRVVSEVPGGVDYLLVTVAAEQTPALLSEAAGHTRFAQVVSGGFSETGPEGVGLERDLLAAARSADIRVLGPNCLGTYSPGGRQVFTLGASLEPGVVGVISQSGGLAGDITTVGSRRGLRFSKAVSVGNAIDVTPGELLEWLVDDDETKVIGLYLEGPRDGDRVTRALRRARGRKPVVVLAGGISGQGAEAVSSHTGSMAGDERLWDAIEAATGATRVRTLEDLLGGLVFLQRYAALPVPVDPSVLVIGLGGGASVLATDACDRAGLSLTRVDPDIQQALRGQGFGAGTSLANPIEVPVGPASALDLLENVLTPVVLGQAYPDVLVHLNVQSYYSYGTGGVAPLVGQIERLASWRPENTRLTIVTRNLDAAPASAQEQIAAAAESTGLPVYGSFDAAATAIAAGKRWAATRG